MGHIVVTDQKRTAIIAEWYGRDSIWLIGQRHGVAESTVRRTWIEAKRARLLPSAERPLARRLRTRALHTAPPANQQEADDLDGEALGFERPIRIPDTDPLLARLSAGAR